LSWIKKEWSFTYEDLQVEIVKRHKNKIEFFVSRDIPKWEETSKDNRI